MSFNKIFVASATVLSILPGTLAAPSFNELPKLSKRWFTVNPSLEHGHTTWPDHKLKYKFADDNSKSKLESVFKAGWKLWTDGGVDKANIDIEESQDASALVIEVTSDAKAQTSIGFTESNHMTFGDSNVYGFLDKTANMAHEIGHAIGFYHEHQRDDRDQHVVFNCENLADYDEKKKADGFCDDLLEANRQGWSSLEFIIYPQSFSNPALNCVGQNYDEDSIMHYPGGAGAAKPFVGHRKTVLGTIGDPNKSFKKNTKPSTTDVARANAMYATTANQKRDIGKDCRSNSTRLTATYSAPAGVTSVFNMTAAPIDITGTPRISSGIVEPSADTTVASTMDTTTPITLLAPSATSNSSATTAVVPPPPSGDIKARAATMVDALNSTMDTTTPITLLAPSATTNPSVATDLPPPPPSTDT